MKTRQQVLAEGYKEDWPMECSNCGSFDCHQFTDQIRCFECHHVVYTRNAENLFIEIPITEEDIFEANRLGIEQRDNSLAAGDKSVFQTNAYENHFTGQLGQLKFHHWLDENKIVHEYHTYNKDGSPDKGDFIINNKILDLKTQNINLLPKLDYFCNLASQQIDHADYFIFGFRLNKKLIIVGFQTRSFIKSNATLIKKGRQINNSGTIASNDMYNILIKDLLPMNFFIQEISK